MYGSRQSEEWIFDHSLDVIYNFAQAIMYAVPIALDAHLGPMPQASGFQLRLTACECELTVAPLCLNCKASRSRQELPSERF